MTRLEKFIRAAASGYFVLFSNIVYTLFSIRLAVQSLSREEYGVWATAVQIGSFLALVDFGLSTAVSRHLIDHKDDRDGGEYGSILKATMAVLFAQAGLVVVIGCAVTFGSVQMLEIPPTFTGPFYVLMFGQVLLVGAAFPVKFFGHILIIHQRYDALSIAQVSQLVVQLLSLLVFFRMQAGVYSLLYASFLGFIASTALVLYLACRREYFPSKGCWGVRSWVAFKKVFSFGQSVFLVSLGLQLITTSQTLLVTKILGLAAATDWNVCTRSFLLVCTMVWRTFDVAFPAFSEMIVRGETEIFKSRVESLLKTILALTAIGSVGIAVANRAFVEVWVGPGGRWSMADDWLLGAWLLPLTLGRCMATLLASFKDVKRLPVVLLAEGVCFLLLGGLLAQWFGFTGLLVASIVCSIAFSTFYSAREVCIKLGIPSRRAIMDWFLPAVKVLALLLLPAGAIAGATGGWSPKSSFFTVAAFVAVAGGYLLWRVGLDPGVRREMKTRLRSRFPKRLSGLRTP